MSAAWSSPSSRSYDDLVPGSLAWIAAGRGAGTPAGQALGADEPTEAAAALESAESRRDARQDREAERRDARQARADAKVAARRAREERRAEARRERDAAKRAKADQKAERARQKEAEKADQAERKRVAEQEAAAESARQEQEREREVEETARRTRRREEVKAAALAALAVPPGTVRRPTEDTDADVEVAPDSDEAGVTGEDEALAAALEEPLPLPVEDATADDTPRGPTEVDEPTAADEADPVDDAADPDVAETDAGETDAGETDAGETDAGQTDAGQTDETAADDADGPTPDAAETRTDDTVVVPAAADAADPEDGGSEEPAPSRADSRREKAAAVQARRRDKLERKQRSKESRPASRRDDALVPEPPSLPEKSSGSSRSVLSVVGVVVGTIGLAVSVLLALGALLVAFGFETDSGVLSALATVCDPLTDPLRQFVDFGGENADAKASFVVYGAGSIVYLLAGYAVSSLLRQRNDA